MAEYIKKSDVLAYPIRRKSYDKANGNAHFISGVESVMEFVEGLPTADVAEVRHARWELVRKYGNTAICRCSLCGRDMMFDEYRHIEDTPYCHCGARMDEEDEQ